MRLRNRLIKTKIDEDDYCSMLMMKDVNHDKKVDNNRVLTRRDSTRD